MITCVDSLRFCYVLQTTPQKRKAPPEPKTPTTPTPMTPRISPLDRRSPPKIIDQRSPTPSFGAREDDKTETTRNHGDWRYQNHCYWPGHSMIDVGGHRVHAQSWWQLYRSSQHGQYYFRNSFGESLWPAKY